MATHEIPPFVQVPSGDGQSDEIKTIITILEKSLPKSCVIYNAVKMAPRFPHHTKIFYMNPKSSCARTEVHSHSWILLTHATEDHGQKVRISSPSSHKYSSLEKAGLVETFASSTAFNWEEPHWFDALDAYVTRIITKFISSTWTYATPKTHLPVARILQKNPSGGVHLAGTAKEVLKSGLFPASAIEAWNTPSLKTHAQLGFKNAGLVLAIIAFNWEEPHWFIALDAYVARIITKVSTEVKRHNIETYPDTLINYPTIQIKPLDVTHGTQFISSTWKCATPKTHLPVARFLQNNVSGGVYLAGSEALPVSGILLHADGLLSMLHTSEAHRGKGFAKFAMKLATKEILKSGLFPASSVDPWNTPSLKTHDQLGFKNAGLVFWIMYELSKEKLAVLNQQ
ncbi:hypothetical protein Fcan01_18416 [Folsomia candida]|uniref:N-acetyltransferase domain-containing protein n=1 Tax=Folsomia candida TaxID=158441 RepID=A0A226DQ79_FOLCA|nr:hypothetical protein Fcan01_18416 [Folsomia candida]